MTNALLLFMIIYISPGYLSPYRIFLGNTALTQLLLALLVMVVAPRVLTHGVNIVNIYLGPCQLLGPWGSYMLYITMLHLGVNSFMSLMVSMVYRCISLRTSRIRTSFAVEMCLVSYVIPLSMILPCINMEFSTNKTDAAEITHHIVKNMDKYDVVVAAKIIQPCLLWVIFCCSLLLIPIYVTMYFCRWRVLSYLENTTFVQSSHTKLGIKRLVKALTVQSIVPTFTIFPAAAGYLLIQFGVLEPRLFSFVITPCLCIGPIVDPMITIYYVSPYRHLFARVFPRMDPRSSTAQPQASTVHRLSVVST